MIERKTEKIRNKEKEKGKFIKQKFSEGGDTLCTKRASSILMGNIMLLPAKRSMSNHRKIHWVLIFLSLMYLLCYLQSEHKSNHAISLQFIYIYVYFLLSSSSFTHHTQNKSFIIFKMVYRRQQLVQWLKMGRKYPIAAVLGCWFSAACSLEIAGDKAKDSHLKSQSFSWIDMKQR